MVTGMELLKLIAVPNSARRRTLMVENGSRSTVSTLSLDITSVDITQVDLCDYASIAVEEKNNGQYSQFVVR